MRDTDHDYDDDEFDHDDDGSFDDDDDDGSFDDDDDDGSFDDDDGSFDDDDGGTAEGSCAAASRAGTGCADLHRVAVHDNCCGRPRRKGGAFCRVGKIAPAPRANVRSREPADHTS
jgi:hypothetical protein